MIGIDLGTTNSEVALYTDQGVKVLSIDGSKLMPSVVGYYDGEILVGQPAKNQLTSSPEDTIIHVKRMMGGAGHALLQLGDKQFTPEQVSAMILTPLKRAAEHELGKACTAAVITVPAYFNENQRQATIEAAQIAGFEIVDLLNEPTAAALAYTLGSKAPKGLFLVYDWGGGTFDVSIVSVTDDLYEVRASHGDIHLGGSDLDLALAGKVQAAFKREHNIDLKESAVAWSRLLSACEQAKIELSDKAAVEIVEEFIISKDGVPLHLRYTVTRPELEELARPLIQRTLHSVRTALDLADVSSDDLDHVILVGGSAMLPLVQEELTHCLGAVPQYWHDPSLVVAIGAALHAARQHGVAIGAPLIDVLSHSIGVRAFNGYALANDIVITRNTALPCQVSRTYKKLCEETSEIVLGINQGESTNLSKVTQIGEIVLGDLPGCGTDLVLVLRADTNGVIHAVLHDVYTKTSEAIVIQRGYKGRAEKRSGSEIEMPRIGFNGFADDAEDHSGDGTGQAGAQLFGLTERQPLEPVSDHKSLQDVLNGVSELMAKLTPEEQETLADIVDRLEAGNLEAMVELEDLLYAYAPK